MAGALSTILEGATTGIALGSFDVIRIDPATQEVVDKIALPTGAGLGIQYVTGLYAAQARA